jgi:hypothetical protein
VIGRCILHLIDSKAKGTIIVPKWPSSYFWPLFFYESDGFMPIVKDVLEFQEHSRIYKQGDNKNSIFGSPIFSSNVLAIRLDATNSV